MPLRGTIVNENGLILRYAVAHTAWQDEVGSNWCYEPE